MSKMTNWLRVQREAYNESIAWRIDVVLKARRRGLITMAKRMERRIRHDQSIVGLIRRLEAE